MSACPLPQFDHRYQAELPSLYARPGLSPLRGGRLLYWSRPLADEFRITSYNVCYTKLLRASRCCRMSPLTRRRRGMKSRGAGESPE